MIPNSLVLEWYKGYNVKNFFIKSSQSQDKFTSVIQLWITGIHQIWNMKEQRNSLLLGFCVVLVFQDILPLFMKRTPSLYGLQKNTLIFFFTGNYFSAIKVMLVFSRWPRYQRGFSIYLKNESNLSSSWRSDQVFCRRSLPRKLFFDTSFTLGSDPRFILIAKIFSLAVVCETAFF